MKFVKSPSVILREIGISQPSQIDLELVAFSLNAHVVYESLSGYEASIFGTDEKAVITVNSQSHQQRQRFSLAHELGHWINDRGKNLSKECSSSDMRRRLDYSSKILDREARANVFASEMILPDFLVVPKFSNQVISVPTVNEMSEEFDSSMTSSALRLMSITNKRAMLVLWEEDGTRAWFARSEPLSDKIWPKKNMSAQALQSVCDFGSRQSSGLWVDDYMSDQKVSIKIDGFFNGYQYVTLLSW